MSFGLQSVITETGDREFGVLNRLAGMAKCGIDFS